MNEFSFKIGIQIHLKLATLKKLFCNCLNNSDTAVCEICRGEPGTLPSINFEAITKAAQAALLLNCKLSKNVSFYRKHYHYRDNPKGYQLTMLQPIGKSGRLMIYRGYKQLKEYTIDKLILEEDPCKLTKGQLDYSRSGRPLIELVSLPEFTDAETVCDYIKTIINMLHHSKIIDKYDKTVFRADINISSPKVNRVELKNIGSLDEIKKAIAAEVRRQSNTTCQVMETREYDNLLDTTVFLRFKETQQQYHYLSEPNIPITNLEPPLVTESVYKRYARFLNLGLSESRAWSFSTNEFLQPLFSNIKNFTKLSFRKLELLIKHKIILDKTKYNLLNDDIDEFTFISQIKTKRPVRPIADVYKELMNENEQFKTCILNFRQNSQLTNYVVGSLMRKTGHSYEQIISFLNELEISSN